jgi:hypothetical protein
MAPIQSVYFLFDRLNTTLRPAPNRGTFLAISASLLAGWVPVWDLEGLREIAIYLRAGLFRLRNWVNWRDRHCDRFGYAGRVVCGWGNGDLLLEMGFSVKFVR